MKKTYEDGNLTETVYYWSKNFVTVVNNSGSYNYTYIYHNGQLVAQELNGVKHFIHGDHLGSSTVVTDSSGTVVENTTYSPFGEVLTGGETSRYGYEGKEHDSIVGDTDFHFRKYKPEWAIFTQPDSLIPNVYDPQSLNRYMFERGNPYKNVEDSGHAAREFGFNVGSVVYNLRKGFSLSFRYAKLSFKAAVNKQFKSSLRYLDKSLGFGAEAVFNSIPIFIGGAKRTYKPGSEITLADISPIPQDELERDIIDEYYEDKEKKYLEEEQELNTQIETDNSNQKSNSRGGFVSDAYNPNLNTDINNVNTGSTSGETSTTGGGSSGGSGSGGRTYDVSHWPSWFWTW